MKPEAVALSQSMVSLALAVNVDHVGAPDHVRSVVDRLPWIEKLCRENEALRETTPIGLMAQGFSALCACWVMQGAKPGPNFERLRAVSDWALRVVAEADRGIVDQLKGAAP